MKHTLRTRVILLLLFVFSLLGATTFFVDRLILLPSFQKLERNHVGDNVLRVVSALKNEVQHLSMLTRDWSVWDDSYQYIVNRNQRYEESNLGATTFSGNEINLILFLDSAGRKVWGEVRSDDFETPVIVKPFDQNLFADDFPLLQHLSSKEKIINRHTDGLIMTSSGPMLCAARPILDSDGNGPSRGTLIMGRFLSSAMLEKISRLTNINFSVTPIVSADNDGALTVNQALDGITFQAYEDSIIARTVFSDVSAHPALTVTVREARVIFNQGAGALQVSFALTLGGITLALLLMLLMLQRSVLTPIKNLYTNVMAWNQFRKPLQSIDTGVCVTREICVLADEFRLLVESLDSKNNELMSTNLNLIAEARKLKEAEAMLKRLDLLKSEFISTAAHELRTPVASVMGYTELLLDPEMSITFTEGQKQDFLKEIYNNNERLTKIIDDILDVSRIETGQKIPLDKKPISIEALFDRVVNQFKLKTSHCLNFDVNSEALETVVADEYRLQQVMENLLSNAIKYSRQDSVVSVVAEQDGPQCKVSVIDQGIGMTPQQLSQIFDKFYRADASDTAVSGLGLGMSIVKQIVEDHGGTIWVESALGEGTRVCFTLPSQEKD